VHVRVEDGGHLLLLDGRHLSVGEKDEDTGVLLIAEAVNGC
jgi:hypothetical protein